MRTLITTVAALVFAVWSLVCWAAHGLVGVAGGLAAGNADILPVPPEWVVLVSESMGGLTWLGEAAVWVVWGLGTLVILVLAVIGRTVVARRDLRPPVDRYGRVIDHRDRPM